MNKKILVSVLVIAITLISSLYYFSGVKRQNSVEETQRVNLKNESEDTSDTFTATGVVAVFINPSEEWMDKKIKENEEAFYIASDDAAGYFTTASDFLEAKNIKPLVTTKRYLDFMKDNGEHVLIDRSSKNSEEFWWAGPNNEGWGLFLFDGKQDPLRVDVTLIKSAYEKYFK